MNRRGSIGHTGNHAYESNQPFGTATTTPGLFGPTAFGLARTLFSAGAIFGRACFADGLVRKETEAAGFAVAANNGVSKIKVVEDAAPLIGLCAGCGGVWVRLLAATWVRTSGTQTEE